MADMLADAAAFLNEKLKAYASTEVVYKRAGDSVTLQASLGSQLLRVDDGRGNSRTERTEMDFIITAADLILNGTLTKPASGDRIEVTRDSVTQKYEVAPIGSEAAWRYSDPHQVRYRIHTKSKGIVA